MVGSEVAAAAIDAELATAMRRLGATPEQLIMADAQHPEQAYELLQSLGARSDLLRIVGSIGDLHTNPWAAEQLHRWNSRDA